MKEEVLERLVVQLGVQMDQYRQQMTEARQQITDIQQASATASQSLSSFAQNMSVYVALPLGLFARQAMAQWAQEEESVIGLTASLKAKKRSVEELLPGLQAYATELQQVSRYSDNAILDSMAMAHNMGITSGRLKDVTRAAMGLSAAYRMDVRTAMMLISRAQMGYTSMLVRYGIILDKTKSKQEQFNQLLEIGKSTFSLAEDAAKGYAGTKIRLMNIYGDFQERVGKLIVEQLHLNETMEKGILILTRAANAMDNMSYRQREAAANGVKVGAALVLLPPALFLIVKYMNMWAWTTGLVHSGINKVNAAFTVAKAANVARGAGGLMNAAVSKQVSSWVLIMGQAKAGAMAFGAALAAPAAVLASIAALLYAIKLSIARDMENGTGSFVRQIERLERIMAWWEGRNAGKVGMGVTDEDRHEFKNAPLAQLLLLRKEMEARGELFMASAISVEIDNRRIKIQRDMLAAKQAEARLEEEHLARVKSNEERVAEINRQTRLGVAMAEKASADEMANEAISRMSPDAQRAARLEQWTEALQELMVAQNNYQELLGRMDEHAAQRNDVDEKELARLNQAIEEQKKVGAVAEADLKRQQELQNRVNQSAQEREEERSRIEAQAAEAGQKVAEAAQTRLRIEKELYKLKDAEVERQKELEEMLMRTPAMAAALSRGSVGEYSARMRIQYGHRGNYEERTAENTGSAAKTLNELREMWADFLRGIETATLIGA